MEGLGLHPSARQHRVGGTVGVVQLQPTPAWVPIEGVGDFPAFPASNSEDVPQDGKSVKGNVKAPPQTPQSTSSSNSPTSDDARPYVFIYGKLFEVPEAYPKGAEGWLVNDKQFIRELEELLAKDIRNAFARNMNLRAKPKASDSKSDLIYKRVFADFL